MAKKICLLMGPGTLPSQGVDRMDMLRYAQWVSGRPLLTGAELLAALPEINAIADVEVDGRNPYAIATLDQLAVLARRMNELAARGDVDGIVFAQGTNSIEETAYFLNLTVRTDKPLIVSGAQRPFTALSTDGPINLIDAMRVAASDEARGMGVVVVTNGEINAARDVTKTSTYRLQTFKSRDLGVLGYADGDRIVVYRAPVRRHTVASEFDISQIENLPRVGEGRVIRDDNWQEPGMVAADNLSPQKAAILLSLALTATRDPDTIQRLFDTY